MSREALAGIGKQVIDHEEHTLAGWLGLPQNYDLSLASVMARDELAAAGLAGYHFLVQFYAFAVIL